MEEDKGEVRTVYTVSHAEIAKSGKKMCEKHTWRKQGDCEIVCTICPTVLIVCFDDERLVNLQ